MKIKLFTAFEIASLAGIVALSGDILWLSHDISKNGISGYYFIIGVIFILGIIFTSIAWLWHYKKEIRHRPTPVKSRCVKGDEYLDYWLNH